MLLRQKPSLPHTILLFGIFSFLLTSSFSCLLHAQTALWKPLSSPPPRLSSMVANSTGTVLVAGESGAFISINTGASWTALNAFPPGRLTITSSGDFFVYGAGVWRFNTAQQRFDALRLGNALTAPSSAANVGIIRDLETSTSGTILYLVVANKGIMRLPAIIANTSSTNANLTTATVRATTMFSSQATCIAVHPATGRLYTLLNGALWISDNDGTTWQQRNALVSTTNAHITTNAQFSTNSSTNFVEETILAPNAQRLRIGTTRLLQFRGDMEVGRNTLQSAQNLDSSDVRLRAFSPSDISAMLEREEYTLFATSNALWAERRDDARQTGTMWSLDTAQLRARVRSVSQTPFSLPLAEGAQILDLQTSGSTILALTTKGVFSATEESVGKANPFLPIPQKILRWRSCNDGFLANIDNFTVMDNGTQRGIITASAWLGALAIGSTTATNFPLWKSLYVSPLLAETDSLLLQFQNIPSRSAVVFAQNIGREAHSILRSRPLDSLLASSTSSITTMNTGVQRYFTEAYRLPLGSVWLGSVARNNRGRLSNAGTQPILFLQNGTILAFARDTTQSRITPTHVIRSDNSGISWQREEIRRIPSNIALGNIRATGEGILLGEDRAFPRNRLFRSDDKGISWFELGTGRVPASWAVHPTSGTVLLAGAPPLYSQNFGESFEQTKGLPFRTNARFDGATAFAFSTQSQAVVMLVRNLGVYYSTNSGANFIPSRFPENAALGTPPFSSFTALEAAPNGDFYALSQNAVWQSRDDGKNWQMLAQGLNGASTGDLNLHRLRFDPLSTAYLSTSRGIFVVEQEQKAPAKELANTHESLFPAGSRNAELQGNGIKNSIDGSIFEPTIQIAPNPASERACVKFTMKSKQLCRLELWSLRGELLKTLFAGTLTQGAHEIWCEVGELPQGVYLCRILRGEKRESVEAAPIQVLR